MRFARAILALSRWGILALLFWPAVRCLPQGTPGRAPAGTRPVGPIAGGWVLPNGRLLRPWGDHLDLPGQPFSVVVSPEGKTGFLLVAANRFKDPWVPEATILASVDLDRRTITRSVRFEARLSVGMGLVLSIPTQRLFLTDPVGDRILVVHLPNLELEREIALPKGSFPVGVAASADGARVLTAGNLSGRLIECEVANGRLVAQIPVGSSPGRVSLSADGRRAFVSNWTSGTVSVVDLAAQRVMQTLAVGHHPEGVVEWPARHALLVVVNGQDEIAEVDLQTGSIQRRISVAPRPGLPPGSSPTAMALHPDGDRLFVCLAGDDALATVSLRQGRLLGLTPVGWYPVDVALSPDGRVAYVANMKSPLNLVPERHPELWHARYGKQGTVTALATASLPDAAATRAALENLGLDQPPAPARMPPGLKHVVFVLKENHTYDDYFGDLGRGDGDPALCFFGRAFTPNQHALADRFVLCDNFYAEAEMSVEGHSWVEGAYFADILERFWRLARPHYDVNDPTYWPVRGSIFEECARRGVRYRIYGGALLMEHLSGAPIVRGWVKNEAGPVPYRAAYDTDTALARRFADDVAKGVLAQFTYITLWRDHPVEGGRPQNEPLVRDNDLATGIVVEALSQSSSWKSTAVFIVQDDPGSYIDHVATHRVPCLVVSPYARRGYIDANHYSFPSLLRTIEAILGLSPLSRFDAGATPLTAAFEPRPANRTPFRAARPTD